MAFSLLWLPEVLLGAGCKVAEVSGWQDRGTRDVNQIVGVMCHHTAGRPDGNMPSMHTLIHGRPDLSGPLAQLGLGRDGTFYVIAAGRANHAGDGIWKGLVNGNGNFIGIEAENTGRASDLPWPQVQMEAYQRGTAAILRHVGSTADMCVGHKEFRLPKGFKTDPSFDMDMFREAVANFITNPDAVTSLIPAREADGLQRETIRRGMSGRLVRIIQSKVNVEDDGIFGAGTEAAVRRFQRLHGLVPDGIVGPRTWQVIDNQIDSL